MTDQSRQQHASWQQYYGYSPQQQPQGQQHYTAPVSSGLCPPPPPGSYYEQQQQQQQQQPPPPPYNKSTESFHCDTCNLTLDSSIALEAHKKSHISCTICNDYTACPKMVKAHHQAVHGKFAGTGFKTVTVAVPGCRVQRFRICVGDAPQDIAQWIADRRKKFPRKAPAAKPPQQQLGSLLAGYGSSSSDDDDAAKKDAATKDSPPAQEPNAVVKKDAAARPARVCRFFSRTGKCRNGEACMFRHEKPGVVSKKNFNLKKRKDVSSATLLRKLLRTDADREMALTLQLLKYIANCNYLQGQKNIITSLVKNDEVK